MRVLVAIFASIAIFVSAGCTIFEKERLNRGGYLDYLVDKYWMKADSKGMRALRAFAIQVSLSRIASVAEKNEIDRQLLAIRIGTLTKRFLPIYACAFNTNPLGVRGAERDPCFYYDSAMVDYATGLFDLAMVALPVDDAKKLMNAATGSAINPINLVDLLDSLLTIGRDAIKYGRIIGALYRDSVELEVQVWLGTPLFDDRPPPFRVTETDVSLLRAIYAGGNDDLQSWIAAIAELRSRGLEPLPQPKFFGELAGLMRYICTLITQESKSLERCQENLPITVPAAPPVLGSGPSLIGSLFRQASRTSGVGGTSGGRGESGGTAGPSGGPSPGETGRIPSGLMKMIQANLCVEKQTGTLDRATEAAVTQAKRAVRETQQTADVLRFENANGKLSDVEAAIFLGQGNCSKDVAGVERGYLTAFEKYRFRSRQTITGLRRLLSACPGSNLTPLDSESIDPAMRSAIKAVKDGAPEAEKKKFAAPGTNTLDDQAYGYILNTCIQ
jgi:hypothetical protein